MTVTGKMSILLVNVKCSTVCLPTEHQRAVGARFKVDHAFQIELEFRNVGFFEEGGKPENPEKNPQSRVENQQQTQPTCDIASGNQTQTTLVGGECP